MLNTGSRNSIFPDRRFQCIELAQLMTTAVVSVFWIEIKRDKVFRGQRGCGLVNLSVKWVWVQILTPNQPLVLAETDSRLYLLFSLTQTGLMSALLCLDHRCVEAGVVFSVSQAWPLDKCISWNKTALFCCQMFSVIEMKHRLFRQIFFTLAVLDFVLNSSCINVIDSFCTFYSSLV